MRDLTILNRPARTHNTESWCETHLTKSSCENSQYSQSSIDSTETFRRLCRDTTETLHILQRLCRDSEETCQRLYRGSTETCQRASRDCKQVESKRDPHCDRLEILDADSFKLLGSFAGIIFKILFCYLPGLGPLPLSTLGGEMESVRLV